MHGDSERNVGSFNIEILFYSKLVNSKIIIKFKPLDALKIYIVIYKFNRFSMLKLKLKHFGDSYLLQLSYYLWTVDIMLFLHGLPFKVIYYLIWHGFFFFFWREGEGSSHELIRLTQFEKRKK